MEKVAGGLNPMDLYRGINKAVEVALAEVKRMTKKVRNIVSLVSHHVDSD